MTWNFVNLVIPDRSVFREKLKHLISYNCNVQAQDTISRLFVVDAWSVFSAFAMEVESKYTKIRDFEGFTVMVGIPCILQYANSIIYTLF